MNLALNKTAWQRCEPLIESPERFQVKTERLEAVKSDALNAQIIDCGVNAPGGLEAGIALAEACLAGLGKVDIVPCRTDLYDGPAVQVRTDQPVAACMASQYAGWQITHEKYFAMGSGPMRAAYGKEEIIQKLGYAEKAIQAVGVLESGEIPPPELGAKIADDCGVATQFLTLLVAPTASIAGSVQVVARSVETCLHKMHELDFDLSQVKSGWGIAPLPPVARNDLEGIGRTNDAVLYGGQVTLWVRSDDDQLQELGPHIPSNSSDDHGQPFIKVFEKYDRDFYKIDPLLFSPAQVTLINLNTGRTHRFGELAPDVLKTSFE